MYPVLIQASVQSIVWFIQDLLVVAVSTLQRAAQQEEAVLDMAAARSLSPTPFEKGEWGRCS